MITFPLAQINPANILNTGQSASTAVAESFNQVWQDLLTQPGIYTAMTNLGLLVALGALAIALVQWAKRMTSGDSAAFAELIWPLVVVVLLSNQGRGLAQVILGLRGTINQINEVVLSQTVGGITLQQAYQQAALQGSSAELLSVIREQCRSQPTPQQQQDCIRQGWEQAQRELERLQADILETASFWEWLTSPFAYLNNDLATNLSAYVASGFLHGLLWVVHAAFQWVLEVGLILIAMFGPIAVGASLLPTPAKPLFTWLSGFFSLAMAKLGLNIVSGLGASIAINASASLHLLVLPVFLALFAPALSLIVGGGSGMAMFVALSYVLTNLQLRLLSYGGQVLLGQVARSARLMGGLMRQRY